jgi:hypothetical protein
MPCIYRQRNDDEVTGLPYPPWLVASAPISAASNLELLAVTRGWHAVGSTVCFPAVGTCNDVALF